MAVEVYQSVADSSWNQSQIPDHDYPQEAWELASFFSSSANFSIIDSYSSVAGRYKGDPITGGGPAWASKADIGSANGWFIIESIGSPTSPQWQAKIQWTDEYVDFDDVSGLDYGYEATRSKVLLRFAAHGGWNLADTTPDFNPTGYPTNPTYRSADNYLFHAGENSLDCRWFLVADNGQLLRFSRKNTIPYAIRNWAGYFGDILPVVPASQPMPRIAMPSTISPTNPSLDDYNSQYAILTGDSYTLADQIGFQDKDYNWVLTPYHQPEATHILNAATHYNQFDVVPKLDTYPFYALSTTYGMLGTIPLIERGYGPGFVLVNTMLYLSTRAGYCVLIKWDGATSLNV